VDVQKEAWMISDSELRRLRPVIASVVYKVSYGKLDASAIDDVVQNVCIKLCQDGYDPKRGMKFRTYVGMVTKCIAIDYVRSWKRHAIWDAGNPDEVAAGNEDALALLIRQEELSKMQRVVELLNPEQQELLAALQEDDFSIQAYADKHGFAPSYVYVLKFRLSKKLRTLLKD
jgi:RNA polymerase sigma factor (sigma-70 family)